MTFHNKSYIAQKSSGLPTHQAREKSRLYCTKKLITIAKPSKDEIRLYKKALSSRDKMAIAQKSSGLLPLPKRVRDVLTA